MSKYVYLCALIVAVLAYTVLGDGGSTESPLADMIVKLKSLSENITVAGSENFKKVQEQLTPLMDQLSNVTKPMIDDLKKKFGENSTFAEEVKKQYENVVQKLKPRTD